jgi:bifunctional enzyme CysN/CysC
MESAHALPTLRFMTCGSVDDGKSTLIGRLLFEAQCIPKDQLAAMVEASGTFGRGQGTDFALLLDGLLSEREQGITIDVAYRYFSHRGRDFVVADTPGHEQYTRNMATGASHAQLAVLLVDVRQGLLTQTRRHARIVAMMGVRHVVLAVNKMDLADFAQARFDAVADDFRRFAGGLDFLSIQAMPLSARDGDNISAPSGRMPWYLGPALMDYLVGFDVESPMGGLPFRMPVQWVNRPNADFRGYCGRVAQGAVSAGDRIRVLPSGVLTRVATVDGPQPPGEPAQRGDSVTLTFTDPVDAARGDVLSAADDVPAVADQFEVRLLWLGAQDLLPGRSYWLKLHSKQVVATVTAIKYREDMNTGAQLAAKTLAANEIAVVNVSLSEPVVFAPYAANRTLGGCIWIDMRDADTVGVGMLVFALRRSGNIHWQALELDQRARAGALHQTPRCFWFTGLSGSGKSTIANLLEKKLYAQGRHTYLLDGDNLRHGLNRDLGFTEVDRVENIRRVAEVARLMVDAGLVVLVSLISPFRADRARARSLFAPGVFVEVYVDTPLAECERRDAKGLYAKARKGVLKNFTGIDSPYEAPLAPEFRLLGLSRDPSGLVDELATLASTPLPVVAESDTEPERG